MAEWEASTGSAPRRPARGRGASTLGLRALRTVGLLAVMLVVAIAAIVGVVYVRVQHGPISLKPLASLIEREINEELVGLVAHVEDAQIAASADGRGIEMRLANLRLETPTGEPVASVPAAAIELSGRALSSFRLVPSRIELIEPRVALAYTNEHGLALSTGLRERKQGGRIDESGPGQTDLEPNQQVGRPTQAAPGSPRTSGVVLSDVLKSALDRSRPVPSGSRYLREIAVKDVHISVDNRGALSEWRIVEGVIDVDRSQTLRIASGTARFASSRGPWSLSIELAEAAAGSIAISTSIRDLHPRVLGLAMPQLAVLQPIDMPLSGTFAAILGGDGKLSSADVVFDGGRGTLVLPAVSEAPLGIEKLAFVAKYTPGRVSLETASLAWGKSIVALKGVAQADANGNGWAFGLASERGQVAAEEFGVAPVELGVTALQGRYIPARSPEQNDEVRFDRIAIAAGGAELTGTAGVMTGPSGGGFFDAKLGPTSVDRLKALWPRGVANGARTWVGEKIRKGAIKSGTIKFYNGGYAYDAGVQKGAEPRRISVALEAADVSATPLSWLPPVEAPRLLVRLEDNSVEVNIPDASLSTGPNKRIPIKGGRFAGTDLEKPAPQGEVSFRATAGVVPVLEVLDQSPLRLLRNNQISTDGLDGKVDGNVKLSFPLIAGLLARDVVIEAKAKVSDAKAKQLAGAYDAQGGTFAIDVSAAAVDASGEFLVAGVPIKLSWQRILEDSGEKQPPLRLAATLDNADRDQLGIDINHVLQGEVPVEVLIEKAPDRNEPHTVKLRADLTNAEIAFDSIAWRKPQGRAAILQADLVKGKTFKLELQNLRIEGDDIAMQGSAGIAADNRLREIELKELTLNVISRLQVNAVLKTDGNDKTGTWQVKVKGQRFDARDLFRSLLSVASTSEKASAKPGGKPGAGLDLEADIDNVIGHNDVSIRNLRLKLTRRGEKLATIDARGALDGLTPIAVAMAPSAPGSPRILRADTADAGQAFRLVGFYPNMQGGRGRVEVNVDGRGPAEKTGTLWVDDFKILNDGVAKQLANTPVKPIGPGGRPANDAQGSSETLEFDRMKVPFSVGHGQFVFENAYLRGPLQGVVITGKVDFKLKTVNMGGTFIPIQGLNNALENVPLFGELLNNGVFGLTFAVQGSLSQPQVIVNPLSVVAPGILRELTQMTNPNPQVVPRDEKVPTAPVEKRTRAAPPTAPEPGRATGPVRPKAAPQTGGGWASETVPNAAPSTAGVPPPPQPARRPPRPPPAAAADPAAPTAGPSVQ